MAYRRMNYRRGGSTRRSSSRYRSGRRPRYHWVRGGSALSVDAGMTQAIWLLPDTSVDQGTVALSTVVRVRGVVRMTTPGVAAPEISGFQIGAMIIGDDDKTSVSLSADANDADWFGFETFMLNDGAYTITGVDPDRVGSYSRHFDFKSKRAINAPLTSAYLFIEPLAAPAGNYVGAAYFSTLIRS